MIPFLPVMFLVGAFQMAAEKIKGHKKPKPGNNGPAPKP